MIDAMQMTVSSEIAKRIDDSSSTAARTTWGPRADSKAVGGN